MNEIKFSDATVATSQGNIVITLTRVERPVYATFAILRKTFLPGGGLPDQLKDHFSGYAVSSDGKGFDFEQLYVTLKPKGDLSEAWSTLEGFLNYKLSGKRSTDSSLPR